MTQSAVCALATCFSQSRFTAKERDSESGNDYFNARYYGSSIGRFLSPDPSQLAYADPTHPQSLTLYSYAWNNPLTNIDPTGLDCVNDNGDGTATTNVGDCTNGEIDKVQSTKSRKALASVAFDAGIISSQFYTTLVVAAVLTSQIAGAWLDYVLKKGWPLLSPISSGESLEASSVNGWVTTRNGAISSSGK
jgi:RHS repeat-associated protein